MPDPANRQSVLAVEPRHHLLIAGTGRAGTSLLVRILHACGLDTELSRLPSPFWDDTASAGLETIPLLAGDHPYVVKSPWSHQFIRELLDNPAIHVDRVLLPVRPLGEAAASRVVLEIQQRYRSHPVLLDLEDDWTEIGFVSGGLTHSLQPLDAARILAYSFHRQIEELAEREIPIHFLAFPRFCMDLDYLRRVLAPVLPVELSEAKFKALVSPLIEPDKIRVGAEIAGRTHESMREKREAPFPELSALHGVALKREVKRLSAERARFETLAQELDALHCEALRQLKAVETTHRDEINRLSAEAEKQAKDCERLSQELQGCAVKIFRLQADLSERTDDSQRLRQRIDSMQGSICWRITWPIRWIHKQVTWARGVFSKTRFL